MSSDKKTLLFIDTNIYLDFYRCRNEAGINLLQKAVKMRKSIILTTTVEEEYFTNRQSVLYQTYKSITPIRCVSPPAFLNNSKIHKDLKEYSKSYNQLIQSLRNNLKEVLLDNQNLVDPVQQSFFEIYHGCIRIDTAQYTEAARFRFERGLPPRKGKDTSLNDGLNWLAIKSVSEEKNANIIIVSRDSDFGTTIDQESYLNDALDWELEYNKFKQEIKLVDRLSKALKVLEVSVSKKEIESEQTAIDAAQKEEFNLPEETGQRRYIIDEDNPFRLEP